MHVSVNGVRLFFDVEGTRLVPDGPGSDHSIYRPAYSASGFHLPAKIKPAPEGAGFEFCEGLRCAQAPAFSTVTARRFCDQQEMSLHTATGRSLP